MVQEKDIIAYASANTKAFRAGELLNQMKDYVAQFSKNVARFSEPIAGERSRLGEPNDNDLNYCCERGAGMVRRSNCT